MSKIEISRSPDNEAIMLDLGEGKKIRYKDDIGSNYVAGTFDFWKNHPEVFGGPLARQLIERASTDSSFRDIQNEFGAFRQRNPIQR